MPAGSKLYILIDRITLASVIDRLDRLVDPKIAPYTATYDPALAQRLAWRLRYSALGRGVALTPNDWRIRRYRDVYHGRTGVLMGNGPSLNLVDFDRVRDFVTFGVNAIYLNRDHMGFLPSHYLVEDIFVAEDRAEEIAALRGLVKWFGNYLRYAIRSDHDTNWLNVSVSYGNVHDFPRWSSNAARILFCGGTVSYLAMQLAYYMGFRRLVLVGFDHHYVVPADAEISGTQVTSVGADPNHFDPSYFGRGKRWHVPMVDRMETAYRKAQRFWQADSREIFNATAGGALEVFPRRSLEDALTLR
jgi:hypothetical protein